MVRRTARKGNPADVLQPPLISVLDARLNGRFRVIARLNGRSGRVARTTGHGRFLPVARQDKIPDERTLSVRWSRDYYI